jgi:cell division protein FtsL
MIRALNVLALIVAAVLAVALYVAKTEAQGSQQRLAEIQAELAEERRQINVINVEIAHLEDPERLRTLARRYLGFEPLDPSREVDMADLPLLIETDPVPEAPEDMMVSESERRAVAVRAGGQP